MQACLFRQIDHLDKESISCGSKATLLCKYPILTHGCTPPPDLCSLVPALWLRGITIHCYFVSLQGPWILHLRLRNYPTIPVPFFFCQHKHKNKTMQSNANLSSFTQNNTIVLVRVSSKYCFEISCKVAYVCVLLAGGYRKVAFGHLDCGWTAESSPKAGDRALSR